MISLRRNLQPHPQPSGYHSPEEDEEAVAPVDGDDGAVVADASCDGEGNIVWVELERVVISISNEGSAHKARTDVVKVDVANAPNTAELGEAFHVVVSISFGGRIGWGGTESACAGNAADDSQMSLMFRMLNKVVESGVYHAGETCDVGGNGSHFFLDVERWVLVTYACTVEIKVHTSHFADEV